MRRAARFAGAWLAIAIGGVAVGSGLVTITLRPVLAEAREAPAAPTLIAQAAQQIERGKNIFAMNCAKCHGDSGQGTDDAPRIIGAANPFRGYQTAQRLFDFARSDMPGDAPGSLSPDQYWEVLAFILDANKLLPADTVLGPENAGTIRMAP